MNKATIRKATGDYINTSNGKYQHGAFWEIKIDGFTRRCAGSTAKSKIIEHIHNNFSDIKIEVIK
jgi:hypothetical protein